jgi:hypothetical protein
MGTLLRATFENLPTSPFEAAGLLACWALAIGLGVEAGRRLPPRWLPVWLIWFLIWTGLTFTLLTDGMFIEEHWIRFYSGDNPIALFLVSTIINLLMVAFWPIVMGLGLLSEPSHLELVLGPVGIGAALASAVTVLTYGMRGRLRRWRTPASQA